MKDIIPKTRSDTPNLKLICEAITQTKLSLDAAQNSLQSMIVVPDQAQTNDKTHVQHPLLKTSPQNDMKVPEQEEVEFERPENFAF